MQTLATQIGTRPQNLSEQAAMLRARARALLVSSRAIRYEAAQTRRQSEVLRDASRQLRSQGGLTAERGATMRRPAKSGDLDRLEIARHVVETLSALGIVAFVVEPPRDTAIRL